MRLMQLAAAGLVMVYPAYAHAQLEEIVVTAQAREQDAQEVAISIAVLDGGQLDSNKSFKWDDIDIPGIHISTHTLGNSLYIRGVGSATSDFGAEQSVQVYLDGVSLGRGRMTRMGLFDLDRIEILKGPQPTYFGRNAIAGALNYISHRPTDEFEGYVDLAYETDAAEFVLGAAVSGPLGDTVDARAAIRFRDMDGFLENTATGDSDVGAADAMLRTSLLWEPSDSVDVYAKFEYARNETFGGNGQLVDCSPAFPPLAMEDCTFDKRRAAIADVDAFLAPNLQSFIYDPVAGNENEYWDFTISGIQTDVTWRGEDITFESSTAFYDYEVLFFSNPTNTVNQYLLSLVDERFDQVSQEFRVVSSPDRRVRWLAGAYYDYGGLGSSLHALLRGRGGFDTQTDQNNRSWSVFGELDFDVSDEVTLRLGGRYTEVEKEVEKSDVFVVGIPNMIIPLPPASGMSFFIAESRVDADFNPSITLEWRPDDGYFVYAAWKQGFKGGGFNHLQGGGPVISYAPEEATSFEVGTKYTRSDVLLNVALFTSEYDQLQVASRTGEIGFRTLNAAKASSNGIDLEVAWAASELLTLSGSFSLLDASFDSYPQAPCWPSQAAAQPNVCVRDPTTGATSYDRTGQSLPFTADWSASLRADYRRPLQSTLFGDPVELIVAADLYHTDDQNLTFDGDPMDVWEAYSKVGARIGVSSQDGTWELAFIGRNLTDELVPLFVGDAAGLPRPRDATQPTARSMPLARGRETAFNVRFNF